MAKRLTTEQFINRSQLCHGSLYTYENVEYVKSNVKVDITCKKHGSFMIRPSTHIQGGGCPKCSSNASRDTDWFIRKGIIKYGNKYDYSRVKYVNDKHKVLIKCKIHGWFKQQAGSHLRQKHGCGKCGSGKLDTKMFIQKARKIHSDKYEYEDVKYVNDYSKVSIRCKKHGNFVQRPNDHIIGKNGCPKCAKNAKVSLDDFINKAHNIHGDIYNYKKIPHDLIMERKYTIICPIHGDFNQILKLHLRGIGCSLCSNKGTYNQTYFDMHPQMVKVPAIIYVVDIKEDNNYFCKVGITRRTVNERFAGKNIKVNVEHKLTLYQSWEVERNTLVNFASDRFQIADLKYNFNGWTECFPIDMKDKILEYVDTQVKRIK